MLLGYLVLMKKKLITDGSVRIYETWKGESRETVKSFSVDGYHYFDATGMVLAISVDPVTPDK